MQTVNRKYLRINRQHTIIVNSNKEKLFKVLCLVREGDWLPGFTSETIYSQSGVTELDAIFSTHSNTEEPIIWTIPHYDRFNFIEMIYFQPKMKVVTIKLTLE